MRARCCRLALAIRSGALAPPRYGRGSRARCRDWRGPRHWPDPTPPPREIPSRQGRSALPCRSADRGAAAPGTLRPWSSSGRPWGPKARARRHSAHGGRDWPAHSRCPQDRGRPSREAVSAGWRWATISAPPPAARPLARIGLARAPLCQVRSKPPRGHPCPPEPSRIEPGPCPALHSGNRAGRDRSASARPCRRSPARSRRSSSPGAACSRRRIDAREGRASACPAARAGVH